MFSGEHAGEHHPEENSHGKAVKNQYGQDDPRVHREFGRFGFRIINEGEVYREACRVAWGFDGIESY